MTGTFLWGGGFWLIVVLVAIVGCLYWAAHRAPSEYDLWSDGADGPASADERQARTTLYSLRSYERRTENVVPRERSKW